MKTKFTLDAEAARRLLEKIGGPEMGRRVVEALDEAGHELAGEAVERTYQAFKRPTGRLANSIGHEVRKRQDGTAELAVGVIKPRDGRVLRYAEVRDVGGTIKGKPWLAIPILKNLKRYGTPGNRTVTRAGISGIYARDIKVDPERYGFETTFWHDGSKGPVIMGVPLGQTGLDVKQAVPIFALRRSVTQKGSGYLKQTMRAKGIEQVRRSLNEAFA